MHMRLNSKIFNIFLLTLIVVSVSGCDFFRILAGRPTSGDIEVKKLEIQRVKAEALQAREDSIQRARLVRQRDSLARLDSIAAVDSIVAQTGPIFTPARFRGLVSGEFQAHYYVIVGVFRSANNAEMFRRNVDKRGYESTLFHFKNGIYAIGVNPTHKIREVQRSLQTVSQDSFFPKGLWVLKNE